MTTFAVCAEHTPCQSRFTGKERDAESGNDYFGARYYTSAMGRFLSPDWAVKVTPVPYAVLDNPQSLNLYAYVQNNPLSRNDPTGHDWFYVDKMWQWQKGSVYHDAKRNETKDKEYEYLLVFQKTGTNKFGATTGTLTLYDQNKVAAQSNVFSGGKTPDEGYKPPTPNGNYMINLADRGSVTAGYSPPAALLHFDGFQTIHDSSGIEKSGKAWSASYTWDWGDLRAHLNPLGSGLPNDAYLHGKVMPDDYTHGCTCERSEVILHMLQGMTVQSVPFEVK